MEVEPGVAPSAVEVAVRVELVVLPAVAAEDQVVLEVRREVGPGVVSGAVRGVVPVVPVVLVREVSAADWAADCRPAIPVRALVRVLRMAVRPWAPSAMEAGAPKPAGPGVLPVASA